MMNFFKWLEFELRMLYGDPKNPKTRFRAYWPAAKQKEVRRRRNNNKLAAASRRRNRRIAA